MLANGFAAAGGGASVMLAKGFAAAGGAASVTFAKGFVDAGAASDTFANGFDDVGASATGAICAGRRALTMRRVFSFSADARWNVPACSSGLKARGSSSARSCAS